MASHSKPSRWPNALGGLVGALAALLGILVGHTVGNLISANHPAAHHESSEGH
jgi:hypothetical protein